MSHSFCLSRATPLRRRPDDASARDRPTLAVVRVRHLRDCAGPVSVDEHTICVHRFPVSACSAFVPVSWLAYAGRTERHASRSSVLRTHGSRVQFLSSPDFECLESMIRRIATARLFGRKPRCDFRVERHDDFEDIHSENEFPATGSQLHRPPDLSMATASISTAAPSGSLETSTVERAGRNSPKKSA